MSSSASCCCAGRGPLLYFSSLANGRDRSECRLDGALDVRSQQHLILRLSFEFHVRFNASLLLAEVPLPTGVRVNFSYRALSPVPPVVCARNR